jgi:hypothetical protein
MSDTIEHVILNELAELATALDTKGYSYPSITVHADNSGRVTTGPSEHHVFAFDTLEEAVEKMRVLRAFVVEHGLGKIRFWRKNDDGAWEIVRYG